MKQMQLGQGTDTSVAWTQTRRPRAKSWSSCGCSLQRERQKMAHSSAETNTNNGNSMRLNHQLVFDGPPDTIIKFRWSEQRRSWVLKYYTTKWMDCRPLVGFGRVMPSCQRRIVSLRTVQLATSDSVGSRSVEAHSVRPPRFLWSANIRIRN
jgi:hypothetical protein